MNVSQHVSSSAAFFTITLISLKAMQDTKFLPRVPRIENNKIELAQSGNDVTNCARQNKKNTEKNTY